MGEIIVEVKEGCKIAIKVIPRAKRTGIQCVEEKTELRLKVTAPPVGGAANKEVINFMAKLLNLPKGRVSVVKGEKNHRKVLFIEGVSALEIRKALSDFADI